MNDTYKQALAEFEEQAKEHENALYDILYAIQDSKKGDQNDKQMALVKIEKILEENNISMPF